MAYRAENDRSAEAVSAGVELVTFLRILWKNRKIVAGTVFLAMVLAGAASFLVDKTYEGHAKVVVQIPKQREESLIFGKPLTVLGYESLLNSDDTFITVSETLKTLYVNVQEMQAKGLSLEKILETPPNDYWEYTKISDQEAEVLSKLSVIDLEGLLEFTPDDFEGVLFEDFKGRFSSQTAIEVETGMDITYSPIVDLTASAESPKKASLLANLWANTFVVHMRKQIWRDTNQIVKEILEIDSQTRKDLEEVLQQLQQFEEQVGLNALQKELEAKTRSLYGYQAQRTTQGGPGEVASVDPKSGAIAERLGSGLLSQLETVEKDLRAAEEQIALVDAYLAPLEEAGEWIGGRTFPSDNALEILQRSIADSSKTLVALERQIADRQSQRTPASIRQAIAEKQAAIESERERLSALLARRAEAEGSPNSQQQADSEKRIASLSEQLRQLQTQLEQVQTNRQRLAGTRARLATLNARHRLLRLQQSPAGGPAEAFSLTWRTRDLDMLDEELQQVRANLMETEAQLSQASAPEAEDSRKQIASLQEYYQGKIETLEKNKTQIQNQILQETKQNRLVAGQMKEASTAFETSRQDYLRQKRRQSGLRATFEENHAAYRSLQDRALSTRAEVEQLNRKVIAEEATFKTLQVKKDSYEATLESFAPQVSEAILAQGRRAVDVRVRSTAVPPDKKVAPKRSLWVLCAGFLVFLFHVGYLALRRLFELNPERL